MKLVGLTYGLKDGSKKTYTYEADDKVKVGNVLGVSVKHYKSGKIFGTVGIVQTASQSRLRKMLQDAGISQLNLAEGLKPSALGKGFTHERSMITGRFSASPFTTIKAESGNYISKSADRYNAQSIRSTALKGEAVSRREQLESIK